MQAKLLLPAAAALGLLTASPLAFEVASIKPSTAGGNAKIIQLDFGSLNIRGMSLRDLMQRAYGRGHALQISRSELVDGGPKWCATDLYDIVAKPGGDPLGSASQVSESLQALLVERFKLAFHHEAKEVSGYRLVLAKDGAKLKGRHPGDGGESRNIGGKPRLGLGHVVWRDASLTAFADYLGLTLDRPVIDQTGLAGTFDFDLNWTPDETQFGGRYVASPDAPNLPDLFTALHEQIGLRLEAGKVPVDVMVIDHAEKPSEN
jgi:uncharacterized protein (TIGR03435 family)